MRTINIRLRINLKKVKLQINELLYAHNISITQLHLKTEIRR